MLNEFKRLCKKLNTRNPFELAEALGIIIIKEQLGGINGYYNKLYRQKFIHINSALPEDEQLYTAAHELGHAVLHERLNTAFLRRNTYQSVDRLEREAHEFAAELLVSDVDISEYEGFTVEQMAAVCGVPVGLMQIKINTLLKQNILNGGLGL